MNFAKFLRTPFFPEHLWATVLNLFKNVSVLVRSEAIYNYPFASEDFVRMDSSSNNVISDYFPKIKKEKKERNITLKNVRIWRVLFSCYLHFEIRPFDSLLTNSSSSDWYMGIVELNHYLSNNIKRMQKLDQKERKLDQGEVIGSNQRQRISREKRIKSSTSSKSLKPRRDKLVHTPANHKPNRGAYLRTLSNISDEEMFDRALNTSKKPGFVRKTARFDSLQTGTWYYLVLMF